MKKQVPINKILSLLLSVLFLLLNIVSVALAERHSLDPLLQQTTTAEKIRIKKVLTADTLILENGEKIHLIGLRAPGKPRHREVKRDSFGFIIEETNPESTIEEQAYSFTKTLLEGKTVRLELDSESKDENYSTWAYVFLPDQTMANTEILRQGFADLTITPPNTKYADQLRKAYQEAHREKRGLQSE